MNIVPTHFVFNYGIRFPDGQFYLGPRWSDAKVLKDQKRIEDPSHRGPRSKAYGYMKARAYGIIANSPKLFEGCTIVQLP